MTAPVKSRFDRIANACSDDAILTWLYGAVVAATLAVLVIDYGELSGAAAPSAGGMPAAEPAFGPKPSASPLPGRRNADRRASPLRKADETLAGSMTFELTDDGRLMATGSITPGSAERFAAEIGKRGGYVKTVVLHSPGGSVQDALKMGRLIRDKGYATEVEAGRYCASSCPLVFAGGAQRWAGEKAAIGVHQIFAVTESGIAAADGDHAQRVSAECQRYLRDMGVDLAVWLHAMETPKDELFYFKPEELLSLRLATQAGGRTTAAVTN